MKKILIQTEGTRHFLPVDIRGKLMASLKNGLTVISRVITLQSAGAPVLCFCPHLLTMRLMVPLIVSSNEEVRAQVGAIAQCR